MSELIRALQGAQHAPPPALMPLRSVLVIGGGGTLGSAVLAEALVAGRFARVLALVQESMSSTLRGFVPLPSLQGDVPLAADSAVIVFERQRHSNGRDDAFTQPQPHELLPLAQALLARGVKQLVVVVPHAPALMPQALSFGLASLDEGAVAALGFTHLVFLRAAQAGRGTGGTPEPVLKRFAAWWLSQLAWMVPQRQQSLRAVALARCVVQLLRALPAVPPGTRVIAPETLWSWSQHEGGLDAAVLQGLAPATPPL